ISRPWPKGAQPMLAVYGSAPFTTWARIARLSTKPAPTARSPTHEPPSGSRLPSSRMAAHAASVSAGRSQASSSISGPPSQQVDLVEADGLAGAGDQQPDRHA